MTRTRIASTLALCTALLIGCGSSQNADAQNGGDALTGSDQRGRASTSGGDDLANGNCQVQAVYFAYDSSELDGSARSALENNASCLQRRQGQAAVTGMTDPRGTEWTCMRLASTPRLPMYWLTVRARRSPSARLYSSVPRGSVMPVTAAWP
ncbi:MAG: hypothetical protein RLP09_16870 [Sandaracinaceae bacterium]